ncbi:Tom37 C-terminal domain-containing protein [Bisporella sp. PMI_857]|nr:Tom37 C-terminal domain-containing protein [Bisporella sp. PMI_857]
MVLQLHVWGPAFSLPSLDPQCLAAIAYLQQAVPRGEWELIASSNPALSPTSTALSSSFLGSDADFIDELPALRNGEIWIGGFRNIARYIAEYSAGDWVLDSKLTKEEGADCIAFSTFIESNGRPLLDLSLYVSSENYSSVTRPLYNTIQPFPLPYLSPPNIRAAAKARTAHLGLSSLDIDAVEDDSSPSIIPQSLRRPRSTVSSLLSASPESKAQIRLDALATAFFAPLQELRETKRYFVSNKQFSSLDCLVLGYLALMLLPDLPQPWLSKTMRGKFPDLCSWTEVLCDSVFGPQATLDDAFLAKPEEASGVKTKGILPWRVPDNGGTLGVGGAFLSGVADTLPVVGQWRRNGRATQLNRKSAVEEQSSAWQVVGLVGGLIAGIGLAAGYAVQSGLISLSTTEAESESRAGLEAFGEAGAVLGAFANQMDSQVRLEKDRESGNLTAEPVVEASI